jgi:hypothetical protein
VARFRRAVKDPKLQPGSIPAALRDEYGADSNVITDNLIMVLFAGFETSTSLTVRLLYELARHPEALKKVRCSSVLQRATVLHWQCSAALCCGCACSCKRLETLRCGCCVSWHAFRGAEEGTHQ